MNKNKAIKAFNNIGGLMILVLLNTPCSAASNSDLSLHWDWMISAESVQSRSSPFIPPQPDSRQTIDGLLEVEVGYKQWLGLISLKTTDLYSETQGDASSTNQNTLSSNDRNNDPSAEFIIRELYWQGGFSLANEIVGEQYIDVTLGKIRLDWGVGYGYRPLDIIKPYRRNPVGIVAEEGAGVVALSVFDATGEWTLLYTDSSWTSQSLNDLERQSQQQGVGVRHYRMQGEQEYQWLAYYDDVRHGLIGGSVVSVLDLAWEFHGSATFQHQSLGYELPSSNQQPVVLSEQGNAFQTLLGLTWANEVGNSIILEYWYDSRAWSSSQWQQAIDTATSLNKMATPSTNSTQTGTSQNTALSASYAQGFQLSNIVQHNVMLHWSLNSTAWAQWDWSREINWIQHVTPTFDLLYSPQDNGIIATQWLNYEWIDTGSASLDLELAARFLTGKSNSAYANLPDKHLILLNLKGQF
ncbi:hypothetical protein [Photobacterium frigidiphilum]|uniref:hypothetical protein n=1 Tax=Photobacterium frigidiphilum TaxID=264736 RepID=UPI003D117EEB